MGMPTGSESITEHVELAVSHISRAALARSFSETHLPDLRQLYRGPISVAVVSSQDGKGPLSSLLSTL